MRINTVEVVPETPLLITIAYPVGTTFTITARAAPWCYTGSKVFLCTIVFDKVASLAQVRTGPGNQYFVDANGALTFRVSQLSTDYVGRPEWYIPSRTDTGRNGIGFAAERFERLGVYLPHAGFASLTVDANCGGSGPYCSGVPVKYDPDVCPSGFVQRAYDFCCSTSDESNCVFANAANAP